MLSLKKYNDREDGFTLVELLIVVLIIGVLAAIAIPVYLGIQGQSHKAAVRADVNIAVKKVQVALTEGATLASQFNGPQPGSEKGETVEVKASTNSAATAKDFMVTGNESKQNNPAGAIDYTYQYDSVTGKFSDSDTGEIALGGASQSKVTIVTSSLPDANTTDAYNATISVVNTNTTGSNAFTITGLPSGYAYSTTTGTITSPANTGTVGTYPVSVTVTNGTATDTRAYNLNVGSKPTVTTANLPAGVKDAVYPTTAFTATGSPDTYTYAVASGNLPTGLNLSTAGVLSGTPTTTGNFTFTVAATNTAGTGPARSYTVVVNSTPVVTTTALTGAVTDSSGYTANATSTGSPAATYTITGLPAGMTYDSSTGAISGTNVGTAGTYPVTIKATNSAGSDTKTVNLIVSPNILVNSSFESGSTNWTFNPSGPAVNGTLNCPAPAGTVNAYSGSKQLLFYSGDPGQYKTVLQDVNTTVTAGKTYGAGMWVNGCSQAGQAGNLYFSYYDSSGNVTVMKVVPYTSTGGWTYVGTTVTASGNGTGLRIQYVTTNGYGNVIFDAANVGVIN